MAGAPNGKASRFMELAKLVATAVLVLLGAIWFTTNVVKIHNGCPQGQILVKSVATYECIRQ